MEGSGTLGWIKLRTKRIGRRLIWPRPVLYYPFAVLRRRGSVFHTDYEIYVGGFPRSGNTFAVKAFLQANPGTPLRSHKHIPPYIIHSSLCGKPGMVLLRNPVDAVISWTIFFGEAGASIREVFAYYNDYHTVLLPHRQRLFFVTFDEVTSDFGRVMKAFNARWGTDYVPFEHTPANVNKCFAEIDAQFTAPDGKINELSVCRPSAHRSPLKEDLLRQIDQSPALQQDLRKANSLYHLLAGREPRPQTARRAQPFPALDGQRRTIQTSG